MPLILYRKSGDLEGDTQYLVTADDGAKKGRPSLNLACWIGAAVVCLLLLLLSLILMAQNYSAIDQWDTNYKHLIYNLTKDKKDTVKDQPNFQNMISSNLDQVQNTLRDERETLEQERNELKKYTVSLTSDRDALRKARDASRNERDRLKVHISDLTKEIDTLKHDHEALKAERTALKNEQDQFKTQFGNLTQYKDALEEQRDVLRDERGALTVERGALKDERDLLKMLTFNLTKDSDALRDERDAFRDKRNQLKIQSNNLTDTLQALQSQYDTVVASRDTLQEEVNQLKLVQKDYQTGKTCIQGWTLFNNKCYYFSPHSVHKDWEDSRQDCLARGGVLAMPKTQLELAFVGTGNPYTWLGLSDLANENTWEWVDGTVKRGREFWRPGEPNNVGNEDCAAVGEEDLLMNDSLCSGKNSWACEA
ncbi:CD209 antigen-like [Cheilinus undulatus]|uniref:CD209 antigen-like n=1 Tax=Cheilinus undulatus TaxID=241271 RepID=UPI001BD33474|nr:CD209 antigen-like [Cheilinus undulatus]